MIELDNYGQNGGYALKAIKLSGHKFDVNDNISPEIFQSVPRKNIKALSNTQQVHLYEEPAPRIEKEAVPELVEKGINEKLVEPQIVLTKEDGVKTSSMPPVVPASSDVIESTGKRIPDDKIAVGDSIEFRYENTNVKAEVLKLSDDGLRAIVKDSEGKLEVELSYCTKI